MRSLQLLLTSLILGSVAWGQAATVLSVPSTAYPTIQSAMSAATNGDTIQVAAGTYVENLVWPAKVLNVLGAGPGLSILDGNQSGACIVIKDGLASGSLFEGFTITNGSGTPAYNGSPLGSLFYGGGVHILNMSSTSFGSITFRQCHFTGNTAEDGSAVFLRAGGAAFEDCVFDNNTITPLPPSAASFSASNQTAILSQAQGFHQVTFERCQFKLQGDGSIAYFDPGWNPAVTVRDCVFSQNTCTRVLDGHTGGLTIERCVFSQNACDSLVALIQSGGNHCFVASCVFADNTLPGGVAMAIGPGVLAGNVANIVNCTVVRNTVHPLAGAVTIMGPAHVADSIVRGNLDPTGSLLNSPFYVFTSGGGSLTVSNSNIQGQAGMGPNVVDVPALFVDPNNGDYRLRPGSPMIDAGVTNPTFPRSSGDVRGLPRIRGSAADMGAYEAQSLAHHPASRGRAGENNGGPFDLLTMNGSAGGMFRRVEVPIGASSSLEMAQPPYLTAPVQYAIYGILGEANFDSVINVPLGIGDMMFAPAPMIPWPHPSFFMLASTFGPIGFWQPLFTAMPTPWSSGPGPAIPFPFLMTIQGILEEGPGVYVPTNALIFEVK